MTFGYECELNPRDMKYHKNIARFFFSSIPALFKGDTVARYRNSFFQVTSFKWRSWRHLLLAVLIPYMLFHEVVHLLAMYLSRNIYLIILAPFLVSVGLLPLGFIVNSWVGFYLLGGAVISLPDVSSAYSKIVAKKADRRERAGR
jgi:hypothetical protein